MRKVYMPVTLIVLAAMALAACTSAAATPATTTTAPTTAATSAPTNVATTVATTMPTSTTAATAATTGTPAATTAATSAATGTPAATTAATTSATQAVTPTATGSASSGIVPNTGNASYVELMTILNGTVQGSDNTKVGTVYGVVFQHPPLSNLTANATPAATTAANATPVATTAAANGATSTSQGVSLDQVYLRYVLVNSAAGSQSSNGSANGTIVAIPFTPFTFNPMTNTTGNNTPANTLLLSVSSTAVQNAPHITANSLADENTTWATSANTYWAGQNVTLPNMGANISNPNNSDLFLVPSTSKGLTLLDNANNTLGTSEQIYITNKTGQVAYIVVNGGANFDNKSFVVPASAVMWNPGSQAAELTNAGQLALRVPNAILQAAPSISSAVNVQISPELINTLNAYWQSILSALK